MYGKPVIGSVRKAVIKICGGWCIGRSPGVKEWIGTDLPKYKENVFTDLVHIAPEIRWGVDFDVTCEMVDSATNTTTTKTERINLHTAKTIFNAKDSTRDEVNAWLL